MYFYDILTLLTSIYATRKWQVHKECYIEKIQFIKLLKLCHYTNLHFTERTIKSSLYLYCDEMYTFRAFRYRTILIALMWSFSIMIAQTDNNEAPRLSNDNLHFNVMQYNHKTMSHCCIKTITFQKYFQFAKFSIPRISYAFPFYTHNDIHDMSKLISTFQNYEYIRELLIEIL